MFKIKIIITLCLILSLRLQSAEVGKPFDKERANVNAIDEYGYTPLMRAVLKNYIDLVKLLIDNGAELNIKNLKSGGSTALIYAVIDNRIEITQLLIDAHADLDIKDDQGYTALRWCVVTNRIKLAHMLINAGADIYSDEDWLKDWFDNSSVICAGSEIFKIIKSKINYSEKEFIKSIQDGNKKIFNRLIKLENLNINARDEYGFTALMRASQGFIWGYANKKIENELKAKIEMLEILLNRKDLDYNIKDNVMGWTALQWAQESKNEPAVKLLQAKFN